MNFRIIPAVALAVALLAGCHKSAEDAGKDVDKARESVEQDVKKTRDKAEQEIARANDRVAEAQKSYDAIPVLWTSDGTRAATRPVASLCRKLSICDFGPYTSAFLAGPDPSGQGLVVGVFESYDAKSLYRTDGTAGGTVLLHRFADQGSGYGEAATAPLYFLDGSDLWTSDGTPSGTHLVRGLNGLVDFVPLRSSTRVIDGMSTVGGGSAPGAELPTRLVEITRDGMSADQIEGRLRALDPPVIARIHDDRVVLDLRTVSLVEGQLLVTLIRADG